ncbi:hypothetical protein KSP39_PZI003380 [Platanthera zijinensis]|uniref:Integrase catalytic domain-containing protein n=1 Tax=Platanthera zijinensis TaxID=2320716 RepID=A0AAP0BTK0_9ASPA
MLADASDPRSFVAMVGSSHRSSSSEWWLDSGATCHVTNDRALLTEVKTVQEKVENCNGGETQVTHAGTAELVLSSGKILFLLNVKVVPNLTKNLISISLLDKAGMTFTTQNGRMTLAVNSHYFGCAYLINGMYRLSLNNDSIHQISSNLIDPKLLHNRLGHVNYRKMLELAKSHNIPLDLSIRFDKCEVCAQTKITRKPFRSVSRSTKLLELIHSDLCDFRSHVTRGGRKYLITFIDDFSRFCHVYLLKSKDEAFETFKTFKSRVENQLNLKIKRFRSDRGGEYTVTGFKEFCASEGIILETTAPYSPQSNGVAERKNRTLTEMLNSMLLTAGMPNSFWGEAVRAANHILNRVPHSQLTSTPYELWHGHPCRYDTLKTWGCIAYVRIQDLKRPKVGPRTTTCVYLGSAEDSAADRFLDLSTNTVIESRDAIFFEDKFVKDHGLSVSGSNDMISESIIEPEAGPSGTVPQPLEVEPISLRASTRERFPKNFGENFVTYHLEDDPFSYQEAMRSRDSLMWAEAIDDEMDSLLHNNSWHLVDLPKGAKVLGYKWVLKKKLHSDGSIARYKARLVAKGYKQQGGIDYFDVYSPVCHLSTIRILLALASIENFIVHQMDVKTAFLNGELDEEIYMAQPEGYVQKDQKDKVCKLDKSIYGLKQAPKMWHMKFDQVVKSLGFQSSLSDKCLYHRSLSNQTVIICLYVDDMLILGSNLAAVRDIKSTLAEAFDMKDLGPVDTLLGMKLRVDKGRVTLSQAHYIEQLLSTWGYDNCRPAETPFDHNVKLSPNEETSIDQVKYSKIIGSLMYATSCTRPDIAFSVSMLSRFTSNPGKEHWEALDRLLRYLRGTKDHALCYTGYPPTVEGHSDASWCSEAGNNKSTSGYIFTLGGAAITWKSKRQTCIALSSMEAELFALALAGEEADWIRNLILDIPLSKLQVNSLSLYCDNQAAVQVVKNALYNTKRRHVRLRHALLNYLKEQGIITLIDVRSKDNLADPLTKGMPKDRLIKTVGEMRLKAI